VKQERLHEICSLAPESSNQYEDLGIIPVEEDSGADMVVEIKRVAAIWLEVSCGDDDAGTTKLACCNKDASWASCSWEKPVLELVEAPEQLKD